MSPPLYPALTAQGPLIERQRQRKGERKREIQNIQCTIIEKYK